MPGPRAGGGGGSRSEGLVATSTASIATSAKRRRKRPDRLPGPSRKASTGTDRARPVLPSADMDLDLSSEHELLRSTVRDVMETEVAPVIDEHEKAHRFPVEIVRRLGEMGWLGIPVPEADGGAGMDTLA